jgi:hypothetical protein
MRDDCPVEQCHFRNAEPTLLYSSALKGPTPFPDNLTVANGPLSQLGTHDKFSGETYRFQHETAAPLHPTVNDFAAPFLSRTSNTTTSVGTGPVGSMDGSGLAQGTSDPPPSYLPSTTDVVAAADQLALYRFWLQSQMDTQMARVRKMSEQFSIPIPNLESNPFDFSPLSLMPLPIGNAVASTTTKTMVQQENNGMSALDGCKVSSAPPAPCVPPALPVPGLWQPQGSPPTARTTASGQFSSRVTMPPRSSFLNQEPKPVTPVVVPKHPQVTSMAPKKEDMAYKTTPCRHFTMNQGWCPWGDECGL